MVSWELKKFGHLKKRDILDLLLVFILLVTLPIVAIFIQRKTETRSKAALEGAFIVPFNANSIWNKPIGTNPTLVPNSDQMIALLVADPNRKPIVLAGVNQVWSIPISEADASTPRRTVYYSNSDPTYTAYNVPIPDNVLIDPTSDGKLVIIDRTAFPARAWSFWALGPQRPDGNWSTGSSGWGDINETGDGITNFEGGRWGGRATGWNYYAGLIRPEEIRQGHIDHALVMSIPGEVVPPTPVWPAKAADGYSSDRNAIPEGARLQLDPSLDVNSLPLSTGGKIIAKALQTYGAWLGDTGGSTALYAQEFLYKDASGQTRLDTTLWQGLLSGDDLTNFPTDCLRVVAVNRADFYENTSIPTSGPTQTPGPTTPTAIPITPQPSPTPILDTQPPVVTITSPLNGSTVIRGSTVNITTTASDNVGISKVEFYINNGLKYTDSAPPYSYSWKVTGKKSATYTIVAKAYDTAGNKTSSIIQLISK